MLLIINFLRFLVGPMIIIIGLALNSYAQDKTALQQKRTATMKILARSMGQLKNASDITDMKIPAIAIASATNKLFNMWPGGSGGGSTRAKAEIWSDKTDFKAKLMDLKKATDSLYPQWTEPTWQWPNPLLLVLEEHVAHVINSTVDRSYKKFYLT